MSKSAVYFLAQYPIEYAVWAGLANIIREIKPGLPLVLIHSTTAGRPEYQYQTLTGCFDHVQSLGRVDYLGDWSPRGLVTAWRKGFPQARRFSTELGNIEFQPNSVVFVYNGTTLTQSSLLKYLQSKPDVESVLLTIQTPDITIDDFVFRNNDSHLNNLYLKYFGTAYLDGYWLRTSEDAPIKRREYRFRNMPADYVFAGEYPYRSRHLRPGQVYYPFYRRDQPRPDSDESVVLLGGSFEKPYYYTSEVCYRRYNELIGLIRQKHSNARLLYKPHPEERDSVRAKLDLAGFELAPQVSSEILVIQDRSISTAYSVESISVHTVSCYGVRSHFLYPLFDDECIPNPLRAYLDRYCRAGVHSEMSIRSVDDWMAGKYDYDLEDRSQVVRDSAIRMLEAVGVVDTEESAALVVNKSLAVIPEERWDPKPEFRSAKSLILGSIASFVATVVRYGLITLPRRKTAALLNRLKFGYGRGASRKGPSKS